MSKSNTFNSRIQSNLLQQNCFVRDAINKSELVSGQPSEYVSLDEVVTSKGVELKESVEPYPITPEYVSSFADSADYRRDPIQAINNSVKGVNLGDITDIQKVSQLDTTEARALYDQLKARFASVDKPVEDNGGEDNG